MGGGGERRFCSLTAKFHRENVKNVAVGTYCFVGRWDHGRREREKLVSKRQKLD